jgi:hypothetical protein
MRSFLTRLFTVMLAISAGLAVIASNPASASAARTSTSVSMRVIMTTLENLSSGQSYQVPVKVTTTTRHQGSHTYVSSIISRLTGGSEYIRPEDISYDPTFSWEGGLNMDYSTQNYNGATYVAVYNYTIVWTQLDRQVTTTGGFILAGVNGLEESGFWVYNTNQQNYPAYSGVQYTLTPPWHGMYIEVNSDSHIRFYQCGRAQQTLVRHGENWTWSMEVCQGFHL